MNGQRRCGVCIDIYRGMLLRNAAEKHAAICDNVDETWGHYTKWDEADKDKYYILLICGNQN